MKKFLVAAASMLALASGAQAADLGVPRSAVAASVVSPVFSWNGVYIGLNAGGIYGSQRTT